MPAVLERVGGRADLLKMDIEGGEGPLLKRNVGWLQDVESVIAEVHPGLVDYGQIIRVLTTAGLDYLPPGSAWEGSMGFRIRRRALP